MLIIKIFNLLIFRWIDLSIIDLSIYQFIYQFTHYIELFIVLQNDMTIDESIDLSDPPPIWSSRNNFAAYILMSFLAPADKGPWAGVRNPMI